MPVRKVRPVIPLGQVAVAGLAADLEDVAVADEEDEVPIAHALGEDPQDRAHRLGRRPLLGQQRPDLLDAMQRDLRSPLIGDVDAGADDVRQGPSIVVDRDVRPGDQPQGPVPGDPAVLVWRRWVARSNGRQGGPDALDLAIGDQELVERPALDLLERVPRQDLAGSVEAEEPALRVEDAEQRPRDVDDGVDEARLVPEGIPRRDRVADVHDGSHVAAGSALRVREGHGRAGQPDDAAIGALVAILEMEFAGLGDGGLPFRLHARPVVGMDRGRPAIAERVLRGHAGQLGPALVDEQAGAVRVGPEDPDGRGDQGLVILGRAPDRCRGDVPRLTSVVGSRGPGAGLVALRPAPRVPRSRPGFGELTIRVGCHGRVSCKGGRSSPVSPA